jgi:TolB-like protein/Tfp pilus assembly protein PilF
VKLPVEAAPPVLGESSRRRWPLPFATSVILAILISGFFFWHHAHFATPAPSERLMLAVLPFENLTGDSAQEYLSDGLTEEMIAEIGRLDPEHLGVIARTSVMHYKRAPERAGEIARDLGVQYILEGSLRRESDRVRVTAQLIQMKDQTRIWSRQYDRELSSLLVLQREIAQEVADEIDLTFGRSRKSPSPHPQTASPATFEAYDLYLKGRYFWNKRTPADFQRAASYFQQSIDKDTRYARAYAGLSDTYALMSSWFVVPAKEFMPKARAAALQALQLDDTLAEAHTSLALISEDYEYDWQTAEKEYRRAIQLDPQYPTAHQWYAECLSFEGRFDEALAESDRARQLDPLSLIIATDHAAILYFAGQYDRAIEQFNAVLAMEPTFVRAHMLSYAYVEKGMFSEALTTSEAWHHSDGTPVWETQAYVYGRWGKNDLAQRAFEKYEHWRVGRHEIAPFSLLHAYIATGKKDKALAFLQKGYSEHSPLLTSIKVEPALNPIRSDPRFHDLLRNVGLDDHPQ